MTEAFTINQFIKGLDMKYQSYKGREINFGTKCRIYKNLHNGLFSVMQNGKVVAHVESFLLSEVSFFVSLQGRERVIKTKQKNVHAFVSGIIDQVNNNFEDIILSNPDKTVYYNPYLYNSFVIGINNININKTDRFNFVVGQGRNIVIVNI